MSNHSPGYEHKIESNVQLHEPTMFRVLIHNDNYTTMDFVVHVIETVFNKKPTEATQIMLAVHKQGLGVCGVYTAEVAETKVALVHHLARERSFPLRCSMEEV